MRLHRVVVLTVFLMIAVSGIAQKIRSEKISYQYFRLPSQPLDKKYTNYQVTVDAPYEAKNAKLKDEYEAKQRAAKEKYLKDSADYLVKVKEADKQYEKEMEEYKKKDLGTKFLEKAVLNESSKPVKQVPSTPYLQYVNPPVLQTEYDHKLLADTYLKLYGFNNEAANAVQVKVTLYGYDYTQPRTLSEQKDMVRVGGGTTSTYKATYYHSEFSYRHPMAVKVTLPDGKEILSTTPQELNIYQVYKTNASDNYSSINGELLVKSKEEKVLQDNLTFIGNLLNDKFGLGPVKREAELFYVKERGDEYADLTLAFNEASSALQMLATDSAMAKQKLRKAADTWNKALKESDPSNKKARIDKDVTIAILFNLLEAYFAAGDTASGLATLDRMNTLNMDNSDRKTKNTFELAFNDLKTRQQTQQ